MSRCISAKPEEQVEGQASVQVSGRGPGHWAEPPACSHAEMQACVGRGPARCGSWLKLLGGARDGTAWGSRLRGWLWGPGHVEARALHWSSCLVLGRGREPDQDRASTGLGGRLPQRPLRLPVRSPPRPAPGCETWRPGPRATRGASGLCSVSGLCGEAGLPATEPGAEGPAGGVQTRVGPGPSCAWTARHSPAPAWSTQRC